MDFKFAHNSITVLDLERSIAFYREALGLREVSRRKSQDGQATLVSLSDGQSDVKLELVAHEDRLNPYDLAKWRRPI